MNQIEKGNRKARVEGAENVEKIKTLCAQCVFFADLAVKKGT